MFHVSRGIMNTAKDHAIVTPLTDRIGRAVAMPEQDQDDRPVNIDWLAFVLHSSAVKDFVTFPEQTEWRKYGVLPSYRSHVLARDTFFNDVINPKTRMWCPLSNTDIEETFDEFVDGYTFPNEDFGGDFRAARKALDDQLHNYNQKLMEARIEMIRRWLAAEFGLHLGVFRGYGRYNYHDHAPLYAYNDTDRTELGVLYVGGNENTVFVQINGHGCKHVFSGTSPEHLHKWFTHLGIVKLQRLDLCVDDFDDVFTVEHAYRDFKNDAFYRGRGRRISSKTGFEYTIGAEESLRVGSRKSLLFWRIYNKALEMGLDLIWNRSEAELKEVPVDILLDIRGYFTGLCDYAAQLNPAEPRKINPFKPSLSDTRKALSSYDSSVKWLRNQGSKKLAAVLHVLGGDIEAFIKTVIKEEHLQDENIRLPIDESYEYIVRDQFLKNSPIPF
ncbi:replication initiation protein [Salmonella enterica subsp. diarizonae]|uniref:Replication initiation protein n=2 Tax=Salmonella diarizonae TaxID=59204 RepID=A0A6C8Y678_SALDZ|nr:replication initiation protein [Salmonella enterica subsp. diarizonae]